MCGIVGFIGKEPVVEFLCKGLERLEYRGYDSAGTAFMKENGFKIIKTTRRIEKLAEALKAEEISACVGIGHTRWATHGSATKQNAHPHLSEDGKFAVVHNGIIENYSALKAELEKEDFTFKSETDTEVIPFLLQKYYKGDIKKAVKSTLDRLEGSYAVCILCTDFPNTVIAAKKFSPLIIGIGKKQNAIASDTAAFPPEIKKAVFLKDGEFAFLTPESLEIVDSNMQAISPEILPLLQNTNNADKENYDHFMMKEIKEQPEALMETVNCYIRNSRAVFHHLDSNKLKNIKNIHIIACGSAYHVGVAAKYFLEELLKIPVTTDRASEYRYRTCLADKNTLAIAISQSGETADTIAAIEQLRASGAQTLSIVNVKDSTLTKITDYVLYTIAGPEIAVATTKGYTTQLALLYILGLWLAELKCSAEKETILMLAEQINELPKIAEEAIKTEKYIKKTAKLLTDSASVFFIGRNTDYAVALEGSLKLKEISYIHSESYPAGELKHGSLSLIENGTPIIALCGYTPLLSKTQSNIKEAAARGGLIITLSAKLDKNTQTQIKIPETHPMLSPFTEIIPLQLLAYYTALYKGCDIDKPRNLAKSVTVE